MDRLIPYSRQHIDAADIRAVVKVLKSDFLTQGPKIEQFEAILARVVGARYAVVFSSGTAALHAAYAAAGIGKGDEVITSPLTFAATGNMALALGAEVVFADVNPETGLLDPQEVERKITKRTKAVVPVDYAGLPVDLTAYRRIAKRHGLVFIEDSAQGLGATYKRKPVGAQADMTMFSFHPVKSITTGEGGAITTNNKTYYEKMLLFRTHGITKDKTKYKRKDRAPWYHEMHELGFNYRLTDLQAALGVSQIKKLSQFITARAKLARRYDRLLQNLKHIRTPIMPSDRTSAWHLYVIRIESNKKDARDFAFNELRKKGIGTQVHYIPMYEHPYYAQLGYRKGSYPLAEMFSYSALSIPLYPALTRVQQDSVIAALRALDKKL